MPPKQLRSTPAATPAAKAAAAATAVLTAQSPPADADDATADYSPERADDEAPAAVAAQEVPDGADAAGAVQEVPDGVDAAGAAQGLPDGVDAAGAAAEAAEDDGQFSTPRRRLTARKQIASNGSSDWQVLEGFQDGPGAGSDSSPGARPPGLPAPNLRPKQLPEAPPSPVKQASEPERFDMREQQETFEDVLGQFDTAAAKPAEVLLLQLLRDQATTMQQMQEELRELRQERSAEAQWWYDEQQVQADGQEQFAYVAEEEVERAAPPADGRAPTIQGLATALGLQGGFQDMAQQGAAQQNVTLGAEPPAIDPSLRAAQNERIAEIKLTSLSYPKSPAERAKTFNQWLTSLELEVQPVCASAVEYIETTIQIINESVTDYNRKDEVARSMIKPSEVVLPHHVRIERALRPALLRSIPERIANQLRQERRISVIEILWELATTYLPGSNEERQNIHERLCRPGTATTHSELLQRLVDWQEADARASQLSLNLPDPSIVLGGISAMTASVIDASNELGFKVNTYKMISLLDTSPTLPKIRDYIRFLRGKVRDLQNQEITKPKKDKDAQQQVKAAALQAQKGDTGGKGGKGDYKGKSGKDGGKKGGKGDYNGKSKDAGKGPAPCAHFGTDQGCRFGKLCHNAHGRLDASQGKCFN